MGVEQTNRAKLLPMVSIIGADGCGKSTVIENFVNTFSHEKVKEIFVLERSRGKKDTDCHSIQNYEKPPRSNLVSIAKVLIKGLVWCIRYRLNICQHLRKGKLVICDHFYFLIIALDPLKHRCSGPSWLLWKVAHWVPKPDVFILLDADASIFYNRKQEASFEEVQELTEKHRNFIKENTINGYIIDASSPVEHVVGEVSQIIKQAIDNGEIQ